MLLALDVGNTNITLGVYEGEKLLFVTRMGDESAAHGGRIRFCNAQHFTFIQYPHVAGERRGFKLRCAAADR